MQTDLLDTATLRSLPWGADVRAVLAAALDAVDPHPAVLRALRADERIAAAVKDERPVPS